MNRLYDPATHDSVLTELNQKWRRTDDEIADTMGFDRSTITAQRNRLGLPRNFRPRSTQHRDKNREPSPPKEKPNPLTIASMWLGSRLVEKRSGYWLDGCPVNLDVIMRAANRLIKDAGAEQVSYSDRWIV